MTVPLQSPGAIYLTNVTATIDNCKIYNNSALKDASAIAIYAGKISSNPTVLKSSDVTITNSIIENNTATQEGAAAIYLENSNLNIAYSSILNSLNIKNTITPSYGDDQPGEVIANNNWWGVSNPTTTVEGKNIEISNWVIMNIESNASEVLVGDNVKITVDFNHVNTTSGEIQELTGGVIPKTFTVTFTSDSGHIEPQSVEVSQTTSKNVIYTVADVDAIVSAQSDDVVKTLSFAKGVEPYYGVIYVDKQGNDNNNGSEEYPVASISKAVELALVSGGSGEIIINEGTYNGTDYHVTGNLTVTGIGDVILDGEGKGRLFYMAYGDSVDKLQIANLTIINVKHNYGAAVYSMAKELILEGLTIFSAPEAGSLIQNTGKMTIKDCEIANHNGGNVIQTSGNYDLIINNTVFKNNTVIASTSNYGIIYISSGKGDLTIEKSKFINSTTRQGVIVAGNSEKNIYVTSSEFINNKMQDTYASGGAINAANKLEVSDSKFINNTACGDGGAINIGRWGDATITKSIFINNAAGSGKKGDAIYSGNKLTLNYCVILSDGNNKVLYHNGENDANAQYNWWGTNDDPSSLIGVGTYEDDWEDYTDCVVDSSNWVVMTVTNNLTDEINIDNNVEFTVDFTHTNNGQELSESIPEVDVSASAITGEVNPQKLTTENNEAKFIYTAIEGGEDTLTITSSNAVNTTAINVKVPVVLEVIYVSETGDDNNNGTRSSPVATLEHAVEIAQKGKIVILTGQYTISQTITLNKDMDIKGEGTVIIDGNSVKIFDNYANLNLTNIKFTNTSSAVGSVVDNQADTILMINACEFYSNRATGTSGGIIHIRKGTLNLTDSKFYQNTIKRGVVSAAADTSIAIKDCEFFNHTTTDQYGVIRIDGADAIIENSVFRNNSIGNGAGIYIISSKTGKKITIKNDTFIDNKATQSSMGNGGAIYVSIASGLVDLKIVDSKFIRNNAAVKGGAIYTAGNNVAATVENCLFINNTANDGNSIYVGDGEFTVSNSVILNENGYAMNKSSNVHTSKINAINNFWGDNQKANVCPGITVSSWIIMDASYVTSEEGVLTITAKFNKTNSTAGEIADYTGSLPDGFTVTFTSTSGNLNEVVPVENGQASVEYTRDAYLDSDITVKVLNDEVVFPFAVKPSVIYVSPTGDDNNDGDKDTPVASLQHAVELAAKGQIVILEGTYKTGDLGIISDDLTITGEGKVIIDADNNNKILYVGQEAKVVLKNLIMINGFSPEESGALLGNSNELTLINCTLANSSAGENNGGAIYNVGKLTIINSTIANNTAREGGAIFTNNALAKGASISIENSIIENNIATGNDNLGGGAIFAQQLSALTISNTTFENNQAQTTSSGGAIFISHSNANMQITDSEFISNHANGQEGTGGGAIYFAGEGLTPYRTGTLTISNTIFEDNSADANGGAIYSRSTTVNVEKSTFINNSDENGIAVYGYQTEQVAPAITANKNWWDTNERPSSLIGGNNKYKPTVSNWAILTVTNDTEIKDGNTVKLTVAIDSYTDGDTVTKLDSPIQVNVPVTISTNKGDIEGELNNGEFTYDLDATGIKFISANVDDVEEILFANTTETIIGIEDINASKGDEIEYTVTVTSADGTVVNKGYVEVYFGTDLVKTIDVVGGVAKDKIFITKDTGKYNITVKYFDATEQFGYSEANKTLAVSGINNVVTPENFYNFFDENGALKDDVPFDELTFKGTFNNIGVISIGKAIKLTGVNATFNNASFMLNADGIVLTNVNIILDQQKFDETDGAAIYIGGDNVTVSNSNITYNAPDNVESFAISVDIADDVKIIANNIKYTAKSEGGLKTMAVNAANADNLVFKDNVVDATIPSVNINSANWPVMEYYSQGVHIENSNNVSFDNNDINVKYNTFNGAYDTIYAVHMIGCNDSRITNNGIELKGHTYAYALVSANCDNLTVSGNDIKSTSDDEYACGVQVSGEGNAVIDDNNITAKAVNVTYPVYLDDWGSDSEVNLTNNNIKGESDTVYGVYVEENKTTVSNNTIEVDGNHVYGVVTHQTDAVIDGNDITANGKDTGSIVSPQSGVNENTTGIIVSGGNVEITNNNVVTNGQSTIAAINTNATINNNGLTANGTTANDTISNKNSNVISANNTEARNKTENVTPDTPVIPIKPVEPVVKITAKNNAKVDYGFTYKVQVTQDGKSVGAGKQVTLKIAGKTLKAKTDKNGYATFKLTVKPKKYTVTVTYDKVTQNFKLTVKNVIKAKNVKVKKSAKKAKIKVTLKTSSKKPIKGKKIILKIKGKKIKAKTNKKGVATFKIKKSILKKLKAGKKYKYQVSYGKDTVKKTLKVKK
ncbi:right-handed parallel beta-helix repeat-containing protein [Methanobrevibacter sp.]